MFVPKVNEIMFSGGETISVGDADVVIIVGANNSGKSTGLREIGEFYPGRPSNYRKGNVVTNLNGITWGTHDEVLDWCKKYHTIYIDDGIYIKVQLRERSANIKEQSFLATLNKFKSSPAHEWMTGFLTHLTAENRLNFSIGREPIDIWKDDRNEISHYIKHPEIRHAINKEFRAAFDQDLAIDGPFRSALHFRVGEAPEIDTPLSEYTHEFQQKVSLMRALVDEGHGMRSFVCCLLSVKTGLHKIILIDEPELFLHPPQARRIGRILAESAKENGQQIIVATHSGDIIQGIVSATHKATVIRINRNENRNHAYSVGGDELKELWSKPILQSSGALQGLFHEGVIICESDADVVFYQNLMRRLETKFEHPTDFHFIHSRGLGEVPTLAKSYHKLNIPTVIIADFDVLRNETKVEQIVSSLGGDYPSLKTLYNQVIKTLSKKPSDYSVQLEITLKSVRQKLDKIEQNGDVSGSNIQDIREMLEERLGWAEPKKHGIDFFTNQKQQREDCLQLLNEFKKVGFFIVPVGELECWHRGLRSKPDWVLDALELIHTNTHSFPEASTFLEEVAHFLWKGE